MAKKININKDKKKVTRIRTKLPNTSAEVGVPERPNNIGPVPGYRSDMPERAYKLALLGVTDREMAAVLGLKNWAFEQYKRVYPQFTAAIKRGKLEADSEVVLALYKKAKGYSHPDTQIFVHRGEVITVPTVKHYPPDTGACAFWLKNRTRGTDNPWQDAIRHDINGTIQTQMTLNTKVDLSSLTDDELKILKELSPKLMTKAKENKKINE